MIDSDFRQMTDFRQCLFISIKQLIGKNPTAEDLDRYDKIDKHFPFDIYSEDFNGDQFDLLTNLCAEHFVRNKDSGPDLFSL